MLERGLRKLCLEIFPGFPLDFYLGKPKNPNAGIPTTDPHWNINDVDQPKPERYRKCILLGLRKRVPKQRSFNKLQQLKQHPDENPSEFLDYVSEAYRQYTNAGPEAPENLKVMNMAYWAECP